MDFLKYDSEVTQALIALLRKKTKEMMRPTTQRITVMLIQCDLRKSLALRAFIGCLFRYTKIAWQVKKVNIFRLQGLT